MSHEYFGSAFVFIITNLFLAILLSSINGQCLWECECSLQPGNTLLVQCENRGYTSFPYVSALPGNTGVISLKGNKIKHLPFQPNGIQNKNVWNINLSNNSINKIVDDKLGNAFPNLTLLDLSNNLINSLSDNSFLNLVHLGFLFLNANKLKVIDTCWFSFLSKLGHLDLSSNEIESVSGAKGWPAKLTSLYIFDNKLKVIPSLPHKAAFVNLVDNPVYCGCVLEVNKPISSPVIKVDCYTFENAKSSINGKFKRKMINSTMKWENYVQITPTCKSVKILDFSYTPSSDNFNLTCRASDAFPKPLLSLHYNESTLEQSHFNISIQSREAGRYECKVSNYISSDKLELHIQPKDVLTTTSSNEDEEKINKHQGMKNVY